MAVSAMVKCQRDAGRIRCGHLGGGLRLSVLLDPSAPLLAIASILTVQALFFADGGLLALGCNIFKLGVFPLLSLPIRSFAAMPGGTEVLLRQVDFQRCSRAVRRGRGRGTFRPVRRTLPLCQSASSVCRKARSCWSGPEAR
jgi:hypothetical protein